MIDEVEPPRAPAVRADGRPLTVSASSLARFRECPRAWWYEAVLGLVRPPSPSAQLGTDTHTVLEHRVRTGEWPPGPGRAVNIARAGGATERLVDVLRGLFLAGRLEIERKIEGQLGPLPFRGRIDLLGTLPHVRPSRFVGDWKTTSRPAARLAPAELRRDLQLGLYAWFAHGTDEPVTVAHHTLGTTGAPVFHTESVDLAPLDLRATHALAVELAERMVELAPVRVAEDVPENRASCSKWGGCPHAARCPAVAPPALRAFVNVPDSTPTHEVAVSYDLDALLGAPAAPARPAPVANPAPAAPAPAPAPAPAAPDIVAHHVSPPDATPATTSPLSEAVAAVLALGQWPGDRIAASLAEEYAISVDDLRAAVASAGLPVPAAEPGAGPAPKGPTKAAAELAEDLAVARSIVEVARGSDPWWTAFRTIRGVSRVGKDRQARILAALEAPPPSGVAAPVSAPTTPAGSEPVPTPPALRDATDAERAEMIAEAQDRAMRAMEDTTTTLSTDAIAAELLNPRPWLRTTAAVELAKYAMGRAARELAARAEEAVEAAVEAAVAPAPNPPAPVVPAPVLRVLLIDALSLGGSIPLRVFLADAIGAVEAAENRPIDLVDYGKGPALVASRVAANPPKLSPGLWVVSGSSSDKLSEAVLPVFAREGWLVVRGVR